MHKVQAQGFCTAKLVTREQTQHRVAQPRALGHTQGGAARGHDAAFDFKLREAAVVCRNDDISGEHQLDAQRIGDALHRHHHGFDTPAVTRHAQIQRIDQAQRYCFLTTAHHRRDGGQVEPCCKVIARRMQHTYPQGSVVIQPAVGLTQFLEHFGREAVAFGRAIDANQQQFALHRAVNAALG